MKVDSNIPLPGPRKTSYHGRRAKQLRQLQVGDSFAIDRNDFRTLQSARQSYYTPARRLGIKIAIRQMPDGDLRLWRVR